MNMRPNASTTDENIEAVKKMILEKSSNDVGISFGTCQIMFRDVLA